MSKFSRELYDLMEKSFMEENEPVQLSFSNRIYKKYGKEFNKKYDYISGRNDDYIAEKLKNIDVSQLGKVANSAEAGVLSSIASLQDDILNERNKDYIPPQMYVPEEIRNEWVALDTKKYFLKDENKRELLEEYLSTLSDANRRKAIAVMCENSDSKNYYRFLDLSTTAYTPNQEILSNDLIRYFENKYLNEFVDRQQTMQRLNQNIFSKQDTLEKKETTDEIYKDTVMNKNYYNPYDKNDILEPKVSQNRQFLDNQKKQDELFEIIDKNSSFYLKQQTEFNNHHLDPRYIRQNTLVNKNFNLENHQYDYLKKPMYIDENLSKDSLSTRINNELNHLNNSFIVEIPKADNIAKFIEKREMLNYQNTLRKHHNINQALDFNNQIANTNYVYNARINAPKQQVNNNIHEQMGSIYKSNLNQNMINEPTTMQIARQNMMSQENIENKQSSQPSNIIKLKTIDNAFNVNQLDPNSYTNGKIEQIRFGAFNQNNESIEPNNQYLENRFNTINLSKNEEQVQPSNINISVNALRVAEMNQIQEFFNKPTVIKTSRRKEENTLEITEELPNKPRKAQGRLNNTKKQQSKTNKNEIAIKTIKINRGVVAKEKNENKDVNVKREAKRVLA